MSATNKKVRISKVSFRANVQLKPYQTAHIEAECEVPAGVTPQEAVEQLKEFVAEELKTTKHGKERMVPKSVRHGRFLDALD
jgi:hypothetical protein